MCSMESYYGIIESIQDALFVFEACRLGLLRRVQRRLSDKERQSLRSGSVYVWEEEEAGMRRWTDGRTWSPSRVHGSFLTYSELEGKRKCVKLTDSPPMASILDRFSDSEADYSCLIKQSLSCTTADHRKLHLVAYYRKSQLLIDTPPSPSKDPFFAQIVIPKGLYPDMTEEWPVSLANPTGTDIGKELQRGLAQQHRRSSSISSIATNSATNGVKTISVSSSNCTSAGSWIKLEDTIAEHRPLISDPITNPSLAALSSSLPTNIGKTDLTQNYRTLPPVQALPYIQIRSALHSEDLRQLSILSHTFTHF